MWEATRLVKLSPHHLFKLRRQSLQATNANQVTSLASSQAIIN